MLWHNYNVLKSFASWGRRPCILMNINRHFGGTYRFHLQGRRISKARDQHEPGRKHNSAGPCLLPVRPEDRLCWPRHSPFCSCFSGWKGKSMGGGWFLRNIATHLPNNMAFPSKYRILNTFFFLNLHSGGWSPNWVHSARRPLTGLLYLPWVIVRMENLVEWMAGEAEVLGGNRPRLTYVGTSDVIITHAYGTSSEARSLLAVTSRITAVVNVW
jgi:hypothetical protein